MAAAPPSFLAVLHFGWVAVSFLLAGVVIYLLQRWRRNNASEKLWREIVQSLPVALLVADEHHSIKLLNEKFVNTFGYTQKDLPSLRQWWELAFPDEADRRQAQQRWDAALRQTLMTGTEQGTPGWQVQGKDGTVREIECKYQRLDQHYVVILHEAVSHKHTKDHFSQAFFSCPIPMGIMRTNDLTILEVNDEFLRRQRLSRAEIIGKTGAQIGFQVDPAIRQQFYEQVLTTGSVRDFELTAYIQPDERIILCSGERITVGDEPCILWSFQDISRRKQAEQDLKASQEQLRNLAARLQAVREEERTTIAREIHDELGQALTGIKMDLKWLEQRLPPELQAMHERLDSIFGLIGATIHAVRRIATSLRPGVLDDFGLVAALEWQAREFETRTGITCHFPALPEELPLDRDRATALFRIFQETLTNVARHADATQVEVSLTNDGSKLRLQVRDNGKGISTEAINHTRSLGLAGMRERALLFGGTFDISGTAGAGTTVTVTIPLSAEFDLGQAS